MIDRGQGIWLAAAAPAEVLTGAERVLAVDMALGAQARSSARGRTAAAAREPRRATSVAIDAVARPTEPSARVIGVGKRATAHATDEEVRSSAQAMAARIKHGAESAKFDFAREILDSSRIRRRR